MKQAFTEWGPRTSATRQLLRASIEVIDEYLAQGYELTLRQIYYQLVARSIIPNSQRWYCRLGDVVSRGRLGGHIDWSAIVDRGRVPVKPSDWSGPSAILAAAESSYRLDRWKRQGNHVEVWCEKDALSSVLEPICTRYHVRMLANRGYSSSTALYDAAMRFTAADREGQHVVVIYLGDHDPSGIDMSRDIRDRLELMTYGQTIDVKRIALNIDQVRHYQPPPNPTKFSDSRAKGYVLEYGMESWELDALAPRVLDDLVSNAIEDLLDRDLYDAQLAQEEQDKAAIREAAQGLAGGGE